MASLHPRMANHSTKSCDEETVRRRRRGGIAAGVRDRGGRADALQQLLQGADRDQRRDLVAAAHRRRLPDQLRPERDQRARAEHLRPRMGRRADVQLPARNGGAWTTALTNQSADVRAITTGTNSVTVTYQSSANAKGVKNFKLVETYALVNDYLSWQITVTNTSTQTMEMGDFGLPLPFNEYWNAGQRRHLRDAHRLPLVHRQQRLVHHRRAAERRRPLHPDDARSDDRRRLRVHGQLGVQGALRAAPGRRAAARPPGPNGLDVFYIHSNVIKSTNRGYLPNTSLTLAPGASQTYGFKFFNVASHADVQNRLYSEGMIDVSVVPSMMVATNMTAKIDLHTSQTINSLTAQFPSQTTITSLGTVATDHKIYQLSFSQLGQNNVTVSYGTGLTTTLQFYVIEPIDTALQRHATFMVANQQWTSGDMKGLFDDWMMDTKAKRGAEGGSGWGDDWGWTHGEFLAEKNAQTPVASEVTALDTYLDAVWARAIDNTSYIVQDWWCPVGTSAIEHHGLLLRPRLRLPARVQHLLLDVQDRQPLPQARHLPANGRHLPAARLQHHPHALLGARRRRDRVHGRADAPRHRRRADRRRSHHRGDVRHRRHHQALQRVFRQQVSVRLGVHLRQHRRGGRLHGGQAEQQHARCWPRSTPRRAPAAARSRSGTTTPIRSPTTARTGGSSSTPPRWPARAWTTSSARSRPRPRSTSGCRTPPRSPTSAPSTRGRSTRTPPTWGRSAGRTRG